MADVHEDAWFSRRMREAFSLFVDVSLLVVVAFLVPLAAAGGG